MDAAPDPDVIADRLIAAADANPDSLSPVERSLATVIGDTRDRLTNVEYEMARMRSDAAQVVSAAVAAVAAGWLINPPDVIRWNADKRYLADLAAEAVPIAPTVFVAPGEPAPTVAADAGVHVVKPSVGAGSSGARRCAPDEIAAHVASMSASAPATSSRTDSRVRVMLVPVSPSGTG